MNEAMNAAQQAYRRSAATQWSRIDLLAALYEAARRTLDAGAAALEQDADVSERMLLAQKQLLAILDGVQPGTEGGADNVRRLLVFCLERVALRTAEAWRDAGRVVATLHSAFEAIRDEARLLEQQGLIPPLRHEESRAVVA